MSASSYGITKTLPIAFVLLLVGSVLGFLGFEGHPMIAALCGILLGILGVISGLLVQLASRGDSGPTEQLATDVGEAVERGFGQLATQLEKTASELSAVSAKLEGGFGDSAKALQEGFGNSTTDMVKQFTESASTLSSALGEHRDAVAKSADDLSKNIVDSYASGAETFRQALTRHIEEINSTSVDWHEEYRKVLTDYSAQLHKTTEALTERLAEVAHIAGNIDEVLNVEKAMGEALETISSAQEFKDSMVSFREHLEKSDKLLEEVSKPRRIQLVESDVELD